MKVYFNIDYRTNWGESVYIIGDPECLGAGNPEKAVRLENSDDHTWSLAAEFPDDIAPFTYRYAVISESGEIRNEWGHGNRFVPSADKATVHIFDHWQDMPSDKPYFSTAFTECIRRHSTGADVSPKAGMVTFCVAAPMVPSDCVLAISGESEGLGEWNPAKAIRMTCVKAPLWKANIPASALKPAQQFKFVIINTESGQDVAWENGANRRLSASIVSTDANVIEGLRFIDAQSPWRGAGTAIPVFSLRSEDDFGVGDFLDLMKLVDWAADTGQTFIQILPINDTTMTHTWTDSYPYNANSTFALHPMYLRLEAVGKLADPKRRKYFAEMARQLNSLDQIDYELVNKGKNEYLREIFAQDGKATLAKPEFKLFMDENSEWLRPYAAFCALRDHFGSPDFNTWGEFAVYSPQILAKAEKKLAGEMEFVYFVQYHLDRQMRQAHEYARSKGVALKGDIPIGISRTSADAWQDPRLFNLDCQAGAPPDDFSILGQNWGFPTYNWNEMARDGFAWWKARFRKMSQYMDAYRIDHILGFFRIWQIPMDAIHGLLGYFNPAMPYSTDELRKTYDFWINADLHTRPYIMDYFLEDFFGPYTSEVKKKYLHRLGGGRFELLPKVATQRKVDELFTAMEQTEKNARIREGLLGLIDNVLFIEDPKEKGKYHPRITAQYTYIYRTLNEYERWCFNRLYNDFYYQRHNDFWYEQGMWKLPELTDATDMLVCAEDLGMIPACVPAAMQHLEILSLEIQRMPKHPGSTFGNPADYPYFSVCTTSTHDMGSIRIWWEENREHTQEYYNKVLKVGGVAPHFAEPWICDRIIDQHLHSPAMLCILPLQDWLSIDADVRRKNPSEERINVPANPKQYWRYRMHLTLEKLASLETLNVRIHDKITNSGR